MFLNIDTDTMFAGLSLSGMRELRAKLDVAIVQRASILPEALPSELAILSAIERIRAYRARVNCSLADAKDQIDAGFRKSLIAL